MILLEIILALGALFYLVLTLFSGARLVFNLLRYAFWATWEAAFGALAALARKAGL
jgi:hypothetical protein